MKWLLLIVLAFLIFFAWTQLSSDGTRAASVLLIFIELGLALSLWIRIVELRTRHIINDDEIITGSPLIIWYLTRFEGYEITDLRWAQKIFGGYWVRTRLVHTRDFPKARRRSGEVSNVS